MNNDNEIDYLFSLIKEQNNNNETEKCRNNEISLLKTLKPNYFERRKSSRI